MDVGAVVVGVAVDVGAVVVGVSVDVGAGYRCRCSWCG